MKIKFQFETPRLVIVVEEAPQVIMDNIDGHLDCLLLHMQYEDIRREEQEVSRFVLFLDYWRSCFALTVHGPYRQWNWLEALR